MDDRRAHLAPGCERNAGVDTTVIPNAQPDVAGDALPSSAAQPSATQALTPDSVGAARLGWLSPPQEQPYDHDRVGQLELAELLGQQLGSEDGYRSRSVDIIPRVTAEPMEAAVNEVAHHSLDHDCTEVASAHPVVGWGTDRSLRSVIDDLTAESIARAGRDLTSEDRLQATSRSEVIQLYDSMPEAEELLADDGTILEYWPADFPEWNTPTVEVNETAQHWDEGDLDVPDPADRGDDFGSKTDAISGVTEATRAEQLAQDFLSSIGELSHQNREWFGEIILARGWSSAQTSVRELLGARFGIKVIYLAFKVAEAWRDCHAFDERIGECVPGPVWSSTSWPRLSWIESARLVEFFGEDASLDEIFDFVECEHQAWRNHADVCRRFPRFKDYLLSYRLSRECQRPDLGWHATLDPRDERTFDGSRNPEYSRDCWEDSLPDHRCAVAVNRRIFRGECLGDFLFSASNDFGLSE